MFLAPSSCPPRTLPPPTTALPSSLKVLSSLNFIEVGQSMNSFILVSFAQHYGCALPLLLCVAVGYSFSGLHLISLFVI